MRRGRKLSLRLLWALGVLLLLEGTARIWVSCVPTPPDSGYLPDEACGYRLRPYSEEDRLKYPDNAINSFGFRDREHPVQKPAGSWRVLGLGDSFVYGAVEPDDNFLRVARRRLEAGWAHATDGTSRSASLSDSLRTEMLMMGIGGYSTENELCILQTQGLPLEPDAVVLCFFVGNDVTGIPLRGRVVRGQLYFTGALAGWHNLLRKSWMYLIFERWAIANVKWPILRALGEPEELPDGEPVPEVVAGPPFPPLSPVYLDFQPRRLPVYLRHPGSRMRKLWRRAEAVLEEFDQTCKSAKLPWVLLLIPAEIQVDPDVRSAVLRQLGQDASMYDFDLPQRRLRQFAAARGIQVLDPLETLRSEHRADRRLYIPNDSHWNERGNQIVGDMLGDVLLRLRLAGPTAARPNQPTQR